MYANGGFALIDCKGLNLASGNAQNIPGAWNAATAALGTKKPIVAINSVYGNKPVSPVTCFGWNIAEDEVVIVGATLHIHVKDNDTCTVVDVTA